MRVHANLDGENVSEAENEISTAMANMILDRSIEEANRIFQLAQLKVIAAKKGQSIVLYIYCMTIEDVQQLYQSLISASLKVSLELLFNRLLSRSLKIAVTTVIVSNQELLRIQTYFNGENFFYSILIMC